MFARLAFGFTTALACAVVCISSPGAQAEGGCPNEALRRELRSGQLPDCRAYEMVSPAFKDGSIVETINAISRDGAHVIGDALGAFAGTEGEPYNLLGGPVYEFSRTGSGWATTPLDPPASRFPALIFQGASRDLTKTLWVLREPSQSIHEGDLYVRESDGWFVKVGPLFGGESGPAGGSNYRVAEGLLDFYVGASSDLSHVIISHQPNGGAFLYEYVGTGVAGPELVGVNSEGHQISGCGTTLGGEKGREGYNAVSSNGERIFFTAASGSECITPTVNELYARIGRVETVDISEPSLSQCQECLTTTRQPAEFQGASEDGSTVFFTTEQELLPGQQTKNLYEFDFNRLVGQRILLVSKGSSKPEVQGVARVSEDGSHMYFVAKSVLTTELNREGGSPKAGSDNLYLFERDASYPQGRVSFIAALHEADNSDWQTEDSRPVQATPDGRYLVFDSGSLVFEYDAKAEMLVNVSSGRAASIVSPSLREQTGARPPQAQSELTVSSDGSYVFFELASGGLGEYHSVGAISNGNMYPIAGQDGKFGIYRTDASGSDVFFQSLKSLVTADTNSGEDTYDARVNGGFPEPGGSVGCEGEACQSVRSSGALFGLPGSSSVTGDGNLRPTVESTGSTIHKSLTRAQELAKALKACRKQARKTRAVCEARARKKFGGRSKAKKSKGTHR